MPPRIACLLSPWLKNGKGSTSSLPANCAPRTATIDTRAFTSTTPCDVSVQTRNRRRHDPYAIAQARARKAANLARQKVLREERSKAMGSPIWGFNTRFARSLDKVSRGISPYKIWPEGQKDKRVAWMNYGIDSDELNTTLDKSEALCAPIPVPMNMTGEDVHEINSKRHWNDHANASVALHQILSLRNTSSKQRLHINIHRCIDTFGRHKTDPLHKKQYKILRKERALAHSRHTRVPDESPKRSSGASFSRAEVPPTESGKESSEEFRTTETLQGSDITSHISTSAATAPMMPQLPPHKAGRAGPDTGSSEVQIAILTTKIRLLANVLQKTGRMDKVNQRNLRLLVHRRQKLLKYLHRKDRGGPRWQHVTATLGLGEGTWKGEITL